MFANSARRSNKSDSMTWRPRSGACSVADNLTSSLASRPQYATSWDARGDVRRIEGRRDDAWRSVEAAVATGANAATSTTNATIGASSPWRSSERRAGSSAVASHPAFSQGTSRESRERFLGADVVAARRLPPHFARCATQMWYPTSAPVGSSGLRSLSK
jgi:hypothetical protein